jgi:alpha-beta hydrolase superfamily lysophospholipase
MVSLALLPYTFSQLLSVGLNPRTNLNLAPYACRFLKDEPDNLKFYLDDGMTRKSLTYLELLQSFLIVRSVRPARVAPEIPILVLRGRKDRVCSDQSVEKFLKSLYSGNITIHQSSNGGHLLLQTGEVENEVLDTICNWLDEVLAMKNRARTSP